MNLYTVHYKPETRGSVVGMAEDVVLVKDGFNWSALFLPTVWLFAKKMWIVLGIYLVIQTIFITIFYVFNLPSEFLTITKITGNIIFGFEGNNLYRWSLARARYREFETIAARDHVAAEHRFFSYLTSGKAFSRRAGEANFAEFES